MAFEADLQTFFNANEFAKSAVWKGSEQVTVIFDNEYVEQVGMASRQPVATGIESEFVGVVEGDSLTIGGVNYKVDEFEADGTGIIILILAKAA